VASTYARPHLSFAGQLEQLKQRGLIVADETSALAWLRRLGYYRLSAYWYPFRERKILQPVKGRLEHRMLDSFKEGATFEDAVALYRFDKQLRLLVMDAIEQIEVAARVDIAHHLGAKDTFAQENPALLDGRFTRGSLENTAHGRWVEKLTIATARSREEFVTHYRQKYGLPLPIWVSIEVWDFGLLSRFYEGMKFPDREAMAKRFGVGRADVLVSWLRTLNYLRNIAAHHCRLWNRNMIDQPKMPRHGEISTFDGVLDQMSVERVYAALCIIAHLVRHAWPESDWALRMADHLKSFPSVNTPSIEVDAMGCPADWQEHGFWKAVDANSSRPPQRPAPTPQYSLA
jgi:abortive infection bacteriophage resistance protein